MRISGDGQHYGIASQGFLDREEGALKLRNRRFAAHAAILPTQLLLPARFLILSERSICSSSRCHGLHRTRSTNNTATRCRPLRSRQRNQINLSSKYTRIYSDGVTYIPAELTTQIAETAQSHHSRGGIASRYPQETAITVARLSGSRFLLSERDDQRHLEVSWTSAGGDSLNSNGFDGTSSARPPGGHDLIVHADPSDTNVDQSLKGAVTR